MKLSRTMISALAFIQRAACTAYELGAHLYPNMVESKRDTRLIAMQARKTLYALIDRNLVADVIDDGTARYDLTAHAKEIDWDLEEVAS